MTSPIIAFDEAGSTGSELLDPAQPVFALASVCISPEQASAATSILKVSGGELKFSALRRHPRRRRRILQALESLELSHSRAKAYVLHKEFMIATKIVDLLIEPVVYAHGRDLYDRRHNLIWANVFHVGLPAALGKKGYADLQRRFVTMVRRPSPLTIDDFYSYVGRIRQLLQLSVWTPLLDMIAGTRSVAEASMSVLGADELDPGWPALVVVCGEWTRELGREFVVLHDDSPPLERQRLFVKALAMKGTEPPKVVGSGAMTMVFPPAIERFEFVRSHLHPEAQIWWQDRSPTRCESGLVERRTNLPRS